ncbi:hypothetical protein [Thermococcus sp. AM4]|uniref:hypothetical protein n=1 Tax=Thermococcus sp. (strain AM4) TaxID=246969 RepID=UPI00064E89A8|nr:hypothetical protein [Thermococcus sp. AM4]
MKRRSIYLGLIPLTIIFIWEGIEFGYRDAFKSAVLTCSGVLLVIFVYGILNRLKCRAYEEPYAGLGADSLHEFLSGKRGIARQLWGIWILFTLPFALFDSSTSKLHFWGFIMPITLIGTMWLYFAVDWESLKCDESDKDNQPGKLSKLWFTLILPLYCIRAFILGFSKLSEP